MECINHSHRVLVAIRLHPNRSFNEYDSFRFRWPVLDWSSTWQKVTRENQRARRSWPRPPPVLWRAVVGKFAHPQRAICGCQACAARVRQNGLSGPSWTFADVSLCSSLGRFAARVGFWPPGRVGFLPLPVGGDCCRGGVRARAPGGAHFGYFCWCHFLVRTLERLSERLCRGGCRGACAARRGAAYPFGAGG